MQINNYRSSCPVCGEIFESKDMQEVNDWSRIHRYENHKGMAAYELPILTVKRK